MDQNQALEMELLRVKGKVSPSPDVSPGSCAGRKHHLGELERLKGCTQSARGYATEKISLASAGVAPPCVPIVDGRETATDFLPPVAGVGIDEYIAVALSTQKSSSNSISLGGANSVRNSVGFPRLSGNNLEPFPPLSRASGNEGDSASSRKPDDAALVGLQDAGGTAGMKLVEGGETNFSWKNLLRTSNPNNVCVDLHYVEPTIIDGEACAVFTLEEEAVNMRQWQNTLLCYVVGKSPSYYQFLKAMRRQWNPSAGLEMFTRENEIFYCKFECENDMKKVIKEGPWYMDGKLAVVKKFSGETNCEEEMLSSIPIWMKLPCLLVQWWSIEGVSKVISPLGHPLYFDVPSASRSRIAYARCCVKVAMEKNLLASVLCVGGDKVKKRQNITYDWVPKRCSACKEFGHMVAECGGSKPRQRQEGSGGWVNNKKIRKGQQVYMPKARNQNIEIEGQVETNTHKEGEVVGKGKQKKSIGGPKGSMYKTNLLCNRMETIKASTENPFQLLAGLDDDDAGIKLDGGSMGNHIYFSSEDEVDSVDEPDTRMEAPIQNVDEAEFSSVAMGMISALPLGSVPCPAIIDVQAEASCTSADADSRERETRGSDDIIEKVPRTNLGNSEKEDLNQNNQGSEDENLDQQSESEEEGIRNYVKQPAECGMLPMLIVLNPKYKGDIEVPKESKKEKKRSTPAPERPAGSRITRHSFRMD